MCPSGLRILNTSSSGFVFLFNRRFHGEDEKKIITLDDNLLNILQYP
jgi:hypothetical protein